jgi:hypothetical protein
MAIFKVPRITTAQRAGLVLDQAEIVFDTNLNTYFGGDGITAGGISLASGQAGYVVEIFTLIQADIDNKQITLSNAPVVPSSVKLLPQGGIEQIYGIDFDVTNNILQWNGLGLDNFLEVGDIITVTY